MWTANVCLVSALHGQIMLTIEPNRPSRFMLVGGCGPVGSSYGDVYERSLFDGRPLLVAVEQAPAIVAAARNTAQLRGWHFCTATTEEGFRPGLHELIPKAGRLVFRAAPPIARPPRVEPAACSIRSGCDP